MHGFEVVTSFEREIAAYANSKYAVAVDSCTNALLLCCKYLDVEEVTIPAKTYVSVPCSIINAGGRVKFENTDWSGIYQLKPYPIYDGAARFSRGMYVPDSYHCLSFHPKKHLKLDKGGMILTNDKEAVEWFKMARYAGRHEKPLLEDEFEIIGWNMYMTAPLAARGIQELALMKDNNPDLIETYPDLSKFKIYSQL